MGSSSLLAYFGAVYLAEYSDARLVELGVRTLENDSVMPRVRWTPEEKKQLLDLIAAGKSWTLISATLKRSMKAVKLHAKTLRRAGEKKSDCAQS